MQSDWRQMAIAQWEDAEQKLGADMRIMEHKTMTVRCNAEKCKRSGNEKREIRVDFKPLEPVMLAQMTKCPYRGGAIERNIPGEVRVVGDKYTDGLSVFSPRL
jgi:hypothetical protein